MRAHRTGAVAVLFLFVGVFTGILAGVVSSALDATPARAQYVEASKSFILDAGWASVKGDESQRQIDGHGVRATFEQSDWGGSFSGGGTLLWVRADDTTDRGVNLNYENFMIGVLGKWHFGPRRIRFNIMANFGVQLGSLERSGELEDGSGSTQTGTVKDNDSGFAVGVGGGLYAYLSDSLFLNAAYDFNLMGNTFYENGAMHFLRVGIGFQYD